MLSNNSPTITLFLSITPHTASKENNYRNVTVTTHKRTRYINGAYNWSHPVRGSQQLSGALWVSRLFFTLFFVYGWPVKYTVLLCIVRTGKLNRCDKEPRNPFVVKNGVNVPHAHINKCSFTQHLFAAIGIVLHPS